MSQPRPGCVILCGGESRRMGRPKAWLPFAGTTMLEHVIGRVSEVCAEIVVVAAPGQSIPTVEERACVVRDDVQGQGPLRGLLAGLAGISGVTDLVFATSTDAPFLVRGWIQTLVGLIGEHELAIPEVDGFLHPLASLYRREPALTAIRSLLDEGQSRPAALRSRLKTLVLGPDAFREVDPAFSTLRNLNSPEDYEAALRDWQRLGGSCSS